MAHSVDKELLSALLDGELNDAERDAALTHLGECADCRAYFAELTALHDALGDMDEIDVPDGFAEGVMARLRKGKARKTRRVWRGWAALAACAAAVVLLVNVIPRGGNDAVQSAASSVPETSRSMTVTTSAPAAPPPMEQEAPAEAEAEEADAEALLETQMLFLTGGAPSEPAQAEKAMDALASAPEAAYGGVVENAVAPDETGAAVDRTLYGVGARAWLTERGWQGESGDWYADAADLRALPEGLILTVPLPDGYDGDVRLVAEEPEVVEEPIEEIIEEAAEEAVEEAVEEVAP